MTILHSTLPAFGFDSAPYAYGEPKSHADFKSLPSDFIVEEVLGFEPCGEGEHLFLLLQTDDQNTRYTLKCLANYFSVQKRAVSYSGLKDRRGLTSQWFSIHLPGKDVVVDKEALQQQGIRVMTSQRHNKKLRIGTHKSNRFHIVLRNITHQDALNARIEPICKNGVPNYFGPQRFGHNGNNIAEAMSCVDTLELPMDKTLRSRVLSTLRAWVFNGDLSQRVESNSWNQWQADDPIMLDGSKSFFNEPQWDDTLQQRLQVGDIHIGGWLPGADTKHHSAQSIVALLALAAMKVEARPYRLLPNNVSIETVDNHVELSFELSKGAYATTVLRELVNLQDQSYKQQK